MKHVMGRTGFVQKKILRSGLMGLLFLFVGCTQKQNTDPIVVPPGQLIEYSNELFLGISSTFYSVELHRLNAASGEFFSIRDITPESKERVQTVHFVLPKDLNQAGVYLVRANMSRQGLNFSALVIPGRLTRPSIESTLTAEIIGTYPGFDYDRLTPATVVEIETYIAKKAKDLISLYGLNTEEMGAKVWMSFLRNNLGVDPDFHALLEPVGIEFTLNSGGKITGPPFPFGAENRSPVLDLGNSTSTTQPVPAQEMSELLIRARATDPEGHFLLFQWSLEGKVAAKTEGEFRWIPQFDQSRPEPYQVRLLVTDGGTPSIFQWNVMVSDLNRPPQVTVACPKATKEWETWHCSISAVDYDGDPITFRISDKDTKARVSVNGQQTDDTTRVLGITAEKIEIEYTPNNLDAERRNFFLDISASDGKMGQTFIPQNVLVEDINSPPTLVTLNGSPVIPFLAGDVAREWDYCSNSDPDGGQPFKFYFEIRDPDNQTAAAPRNQHPDEVAVTFGGPLKEALRPLTEAEGCPVSTPEVMYFCYEWRPTSFPRTGNLTLQLKDNHGGITQIPSEAHPNPITLTSLDRNVRPCLTTSQTTNLRTEAIPQGTDTFEATDGDGTAPWLELAGVPFEVLPLLSSTASGQAPLVARRSFFDPTWLIRFDRNNPGGATSSAGYGVRFSRDLSGTLIFERSAPHTGDLTIPAGYGISTPGTNPRVKFEVAQDVVMKAQDRSVAVPIRAVNRKVAVGKLNRFLTPITGVTVANESILDGSGSVRLTRTIGSSVTIPAGTQIGTNEVADGTDTLRYELIDNLVITTSQTSILARARRVPIPLAAGTVTQITSAALPGPVLTVTNPAVVQDWPYYTLARDLQKGTTMGVDRFCWIRRAADGNELPPATPLTTVSFVLPGDAQVSTDGTLGLEGWARLQRMNTAAALSIPAGTSMRSADATFYVTSEAFTLAPGSTGGLIRVRRDRHLNPVHADNGEIVANMERLCTSWSDTNYPPTFISSSLLKVTEGQSVNDFLIEVTDNITNPSEPRDFLDRHTFSGNFLSLPPAGNLLLCRNPGDDPTNISSPACQPCTNTNGTYFEGSKCYIRFKPAADDIAKNFTLNLTVNDNGLDTPLGTNIRSLPVNLVVVEINDPPVFTDVDWNPIANSSPTTAEPLGEYIENTQSQYRFYMTDPDRGADQKTFRLPTLVRTHQFVSPSGWQVVANPAAVTIQAVGSTEFLSGGIGSRYTAQIRWTPNDADAKRLAGPNGFVLEIRSCDLGSSDSPSACSTGFYNLKVRNINNIPTIATTTPISEIVMQVDTFGNKTFSATDKDYFANNFPNSTRQTYLSFCATPDVYNCEADRSGWPAVVGSYDPAYTANAGVATCRSGGGLSALKLPQFIRNNPQAGSISSSTRVFSFGFQWCPQRRHIGTHTVYFNLTDNGDEDQRGPSSRLPAQKTQIPVQLKVIAPVFFESPGRDGSGVLDHWMREAYALTDYNYELLLNNSRGNLLRVELQRRALVAGQAVGNPELVVRRLTDNAILRRSTTLITNFNTKTERIVLLWKPYGETTTSLYVSDPVNQNTWPEFQLFVRDQSITSENDMVNFRVKVKNPLSPGLNVGPQITSVWPTCTVCIQSEQEPQVYSVAASDLNDAVLHYRWYVNNLLAADFGPTFTFTPNADDAFLPAATPGLHALRVEVVDGQETVKATYQWSVRVRNTVPIAQRMTYTDSAKTLWHLQQAIQTRFAAITNLTWGPTVGVPTTAGANAFNHLLISGSYTRASQQRNFILRIPFTNSLHNDATPKDAALVSEILPWTVGRTSKQVSYRLSNASTLAEILVTPNDDPSFPFSSLSDGVRLSPNLNSVSSLNPTTNLCNGTCAQSFFRGINSDSPFAPAGSMMSGGGLPTASLDKMGTPYFFYASDEGTSLSWSRALGPSSLFATLSDNDRVADLAVNKVTQRLYATVRDPALQRNFLYVYDLKQLESETVPLITVLTIDDPDHPGLPADHRILDLAVDETNHFVYALLPGTGAVAKLHDPGVGIPNASHLEFVGLGSIGISLSDDPGSGRKLVFNPRTAILMGIIRDSNEVFIIDTSTFVLKKFKTESALDELVVFPNNDLTLGIQKPSPTGTPAEGLIYYIR